MKLMKRHHEPKSGPLAPAPDGFTPFWPFRQLQNRLDRFFDEPFGGWLTTRDPFMEDWMPAVNVYEEKHNVIVKAEMPGMKKGGFKIYLTGEGLNLTGERKVQHEEKTAGLYRSEWGYGRFHRIIPLPAPVNASRIEARYKNGILTITCPKSGSARHQEVEIKAD